MTSQTNQSINFSDMSFAKQSDRFSSVRSHMFQMALILPTCPSPCFMDLPYQAQLLWPSTENVYRWSESLILTPTVAYIRINNTYIICIRIHPFWLTCPVISKISRIFCSFGIASGAYWWTRTIGNPLRCRKALWSSAITAGSVGTEWSLEFVWRGK